MTDLVKAYLKQKSNISIGIIAGRNLQIKTYAAWMTDAGIPHEIIQRDTTFSMAKPGVKIVNVFNAKGLEFTRVIIPQFIEGNFPYRFQSDDEEEMQAFLAKSRNLIYVGMTRAKYSLDIVYSGDNGSRFIGEMDETLYESSGLLAKEYIALDQLYTDLIRTTNVKEIKFVPMQLWKDLWMATIESVIEDAGIQDQKKVALMMAFSDKVFRLNSETTVQRHLEEKEKSRRYAKYFRECFCLETGQPMQFWRWIYKLRRSNSGKTGRLFWKMFSISVLE